MRVVLPIVLAAVVLAAPAARAEGAPDLAAGRARAARLAGERTRVEGERARLQARLDTLAAEIARLKAHHDAAAPLFTDPELDRRLKAAQALSAKVDALTSQAAGLSARLRAADQALLAAYDAALDRARAGLAHAGRDDRDAAQATVARLEAGRRAAAADLARLAPPDDATRVPAVNPASDDPQALEAQADLLRDTRDRLARRLAGLEDRARRLKRQRDLAGQMNGFLSETRLFDEQDRTASRMTTDTVGASGSGGGGAQTAAGGANPGATSGGAPAPAPGRHRQRQRGRREHRQRHRRRRDERAHGTDHARHRHRRRDRRPPAGAPAHPRRRQRHPRHPRPPRRRRLPRRRAGPGEAPRGPDPPPRRQGQGPRPEGPGPRAPVTAPAC